MAEISIALPVYNGEDMLWESLECLRTQTFTDFEVVILDNCSTDSSPAIAQDFVDRDPRFRMIKNPTNIGALNNFTKGLRLATAPFFLWRAFDDITDSCYLEKLHTALAQDERKVFATCNVRTLLLDGERNRVFPPPQLDGRELSDIKTLLFSSNAGWFYGLWRREPLLAVWEEMLSAFPYAWASDHLIMFPFLITRSVAFSDETTFVKYIKRTSKDARSLERPPASEMLKLRQEFSDWCGKEIDKTFQHRLTMRAILHVLLFFYVNKRVYRLTSIFRRSVAEAFSQKKTS